VHRPRRPVATVLLAALPLALASVAVAPAATGAPRERAKVPVAEGYGGAVSTVDVEATRVGIDVLRRGGNAVDAAVASAAALGVTEPFSAGIGGGGFFVYYEAATGRVHTIDGRETAPQAMRSDSFVEDGVAIPFGEAVSSGLSVGVPGTPETWDVALERWGTLDLARALRPAARVARSGFRVDATFRDQTASNAARFDDFTSTAELFLPGGQPPAVGSWFRNRDLAATYDRSVARASTSCTPASSPTTSSPRCRTHPWPPTPGATCAAVRWSSPTWRPTRRRCASRP